MADRAAGEAAGAAGAAGGEGTCVARKQHKPDEHGLHTRLI